MSAFYVDDRLIIQMIAVAQEHAEDKVLRVNTLHNFALDYQEDRQLLAELLRTANVRSLKARDGDRLSPAELVAEITYETPERLVSREQAFVFLRCYIYQSCEFQGWEGSLAKRVCDRLTAIYDVGDVPYSAYAWGYVPDDIEWAD